MPAIVVIIPAVSTCRTRLLSLSAMNIIPALFNQTLRGLLKAANVAGPLSPPNAALPLPATVERTPLVILIVRIRCLSRSAK